MERQRILVLCALDQEDHQKGHDRRSGIDYELPCIRVMKERTGDDPDYYDQNCKHKRDGRSRSLGGLM
jgi:hypothetical protein